MFTFRFPTKYFISTLLIHGVLGSFIDILASMLNRLSQPLSHFYNESISLHYGMHLDEDGGIQITSLMGNLSLVSGIISLIIILPKMDTLGRKTISVYFKGFFAVTASLCVFISKYFNSIELFGFSQILIGITSPLRLGVTKLYVSECVDDRLRGEYF